ncbi:MAG: HAMP domain-containing sensor histidine kinase [Cytophagales bacterium]|nr:HAMP domain-containing sensor histidine kinase [Cytophagales bacterium]
MLTKLGYYRIATFMGLLSVNFALYAVASSETSATALHLFLGAVAFAALVIYGYDEWYLGLAFMILSLALYFACFLSTYSPLPERRFTQEEIDTFFIVNSLSYAGICAYLFYLTLKMNHKSEKTLREKENEIKLQNEKLLKTNKELDRFVYSASHDLRAPLSSIAGLITISEATQEVPELKEYLGMIKGRIKVLDKFIVDIINYSRNTRLELDCEKLNLKDLIHEITEGLKYTDGADSLSIENTIDPQWEIESDPTRLRMILNNLISNAIRYHDKNKVEKSIYIEAHKNATEIEIRVRDNGIGIPQQHQEKIFDMFFKASDNSNGSGLGLYIANEATIKLGGRISVTSAVGKGSTFSIFLPV